jgi:opacity protein-like surface antigen
MKKRISLSLLFVALLAAAWAAAWAEYHPGTIDCPTDGQAMTFDHLVIGSNQSGPGDHNVCWYKHTVLWKGNRETHTAYIPCTN